MTDCGSVGPPRSVNRDFAAWVRVMVVPLGIALASGLTPRVAAATESLPPGVVVARSPESFHNANLLTFHRVEGFRRLGAPLERE